MKGRPLLLAGALALSLPHTAHAVVVADVEADVTFSVAALPGHDTGAPVAYVDGVNFVDGELTDGNTLKSFQQRTATDAEPATGGAALAPTAASGSVAPKLVDGVLTGVVVRASGHTDGLVPPAVPYGIGLFRAEASFNYPNSFSGLSQLTIPAYTLFTVTGTVRAGLSASEPSHEYATALAGVTLGSEFCTASLLAYGGESFSQAHGCALSYANTTDVAVTLTFGVGASVYGISDVAAPAVPEPASWALMLGGMAAVGAAARRRRG